MLLEVPEGRRSSDLERCKGPAVSSGRTLEKALELAAEILGVGLRAMPLPPERCRTGGWSTWRGSGTAGPGSAGCGSGDADGLR
ncbi:hypothetical protein [Nonomuraea sp. GTA35]|uniref:hypothetical protein n=1 Tax=Nonomuraea sp. GTA35 TaxID=1676746 RepID=UPI0035C246E2